ncbi:hypothetical protein EDD18DRAFT_242612 [Armillaria luteobubalina]|uniref:Uncharacterized protein n=1 Tax=Armillaria luteobubalina TaxID=153913 RepID=A0AA39Q468_9AGAR|nr:hypothetical protein EDD18DRAFT_242612 [Armillaria luteobubalina]
MYQVVPFALKKASKISTRALLGVTRNSSSVHGNDPVVIEREKRKSLSKSRYQTSAPINGAEGWNEFLATDSEVSVKADRDTGVSMTDLQEKTVTHIHSARQQDGEFPDKAMAGKDGQPIDKQNKRGV